MTNCDCARKEIFDFNENPTQEKILSIKVRLNHMDDFSKQANSLRAALYNNITKCMLILSRYMGDHSRLLMFAEVRDFTFENPQVLEIELFKQWFEDAQHILKRKDER